MPDLANPIISKPEVPEKIQAYYLSNNVDTFQFDRRLHKLVVEDPDNEFKVSMYFLLLKYYVYAHIQFNQKAKLQDYIDICIIFICFRTCGSSALRYERMHRFLAYCRGLKL